MSISATVCRAEGNGFSVSSSPHDRRVGLAEAVDGLLGVADDEEAAALGEGVLHQGEEIPPLDRRGVLELVDEVVEDPLADAEVDVGHDVAREERRPASG